MRTNQKIFTYITVSFLSIILISISLGIYYYFCSQKDLTTSLSDTFNNEDRDLISDEDTEEDQAFKTDDNINIDYFVTANIVWWDQSSGYQVIADHPGVFDAINPFWYSIDKKGSINKTNYAENPDLLSLCKNNNILILPTVTNAHSKENATEILTNTQTKKLAIDNIISLISTFDYDGIQLDFENVDPNLKDEFSSFIDELSSQIHSQNKIIITALHSKTSDPGIAEASRSQDWNKIGEYSDYINIMAYDYHWSTSEAGEIAPVSWIREILDYGIDKVDPQKILLGVNFYGYDWVGEKATAVEYSDIPSIINTFNISPTMTLEKEKYLFYEKDNFEHKVYYADHETLTERLTIVQNYEIAGIAIWRLGNEDPENFNVISDIFNK